MSDNKGPSKVSAIDKTQQEVEEDDDDEDEEDEYDDAHGSNVVATLCRKVPKDKENLVIAVVVSSKGDRHDARACAKAHMDKLKRRFIGDDNKVITCKMIAKMNTEKSKEDAENSEPADGNDGENDTADTTAPNATVEPVTEEPEPETEPGAQPIEKEPYSPDEFMNVFYRSNQTSSFPLVGCEVTKRQAKSYLEKNAQALQNLKKDGQVQNTTWIIPHSSVTGADAAATRTYYNIGTGDKTVVVVLSAFFLSKQDQTPQSTAIAKSKRKTNDEDLPRKLDKHILVCSIPAFQFRSKQKDALKHYKDTFNQVKAFIEYYNSNVAGEADDKLPKIERIALSYPPALYEKYKNLQAAENKKKIGPKKAQPAAKASKEPAKKKNSTGQPAQKSSAKSQTVEDSTSESDGYTSDGSSSSSSSGSSGSSISSGSSSGDDEQPTNVSQKVLGKKTITGYGSGEDDQYSVEEDDWIKSLKVLDELKPKLKMYLMHEDDKPWQAPPEVIEHFGEKFLTRKFPDCIDIANSAPDEDEDEDDDEEKVDKIDLDDVPSTLFICDRVAGKMVGNDNSSTTTGGVFGSWVPMHYTAVRVVDTDKYSNATEINDLIKVILVNNKK
jgi:hypothetical protein